MPTDKVTVATEIGKDTDLWRRFEEHEQDYNSRAEALRAALRDGLEAGDRDEKWVRFGEFLHVTATAAAFILFFGFVASAVAIGLGYAVAAPPGLLATLALGGVAVAVLSEYLTGLMRWLDGLALLLERRLRQKGRT